MRQIYPHAYEPLNPQAVWYRTRCKHCNGQPGEPIHLHKLPGMESLADFLMPWQITEAAEPAPVVERPKPQMSLFGGEL
jgi:hypothetical protein